MGLVPVVTIALGDNDLTGIGYDWQANRTAPAKMLRVYPGLAQDLFVFDLGDGHADHLSIFSPSGDLVKRIRNNHDGRFFVWNGTDIDNAKATPGIYLYKITLDGKNVTGRVVKAN